MKFFLVGCITTLALIAVGGYVFLYLGLLNFRADQIPSEFEQKYATDALGASTKRHASNLNNPIQTTTANLLEGMKLYKANCSGCHGDPGDPHPTVGISFYPPAPPGMPQTLLLLAANLSSVLRRPSRG